MEERKENTQRDIEDFDFYKEINQPKLLDAIEKIQRQLMAIETCSEYCTTTKDDILYSEEILQHLYRLYNSLLDRKQEEVFKAFKRSK